LKKTGLVFSFFAVGLRNFKSVCLLSCGASANKFCVLELIVCPQFIVIFSDVIKHIYFVLLESGAFCSMTVGRAVCFVGHPRLKAMNRSLPCIWVQGDDVGEACSTHGAVRSKNSFDWKDHVQVLDVCGRIILKCIFDE
jgi:hypothetical protein